MLNKFCKIFSIGLTSTLALAVSASNARAYDFTFTDIVAGTNTVNGTFSINDAVIPTDGSTVVLSEADFQDWEINFSGTTNTTLFGDASGFGADNSDIISGVFPVGKITASNTELTFPASIDGSVGERFCLTGGTPCNFPTESPLLAILSNDATNISVFSGDSTSNLTTLSGALVVPAAATPVPFGVSTDLSILILGGLYGASRLRKKLAANK